MARKDCPAFDKKCIACGTIGHFKAVCEKSSSSGVAKYGGDPATTYDDDDEPPAFSFGSRSAEGGAVFRKADQYQPTR